MRVSHAPNGPSPRQLGERAIGGHEGLLGGVLGLVQVAEDPVAGPDDRGRLALDEAAEGVAVPGEDGLDRRAVAGEVIGPVGQVGSGLADGRISVGSGARWRRTRSVGPPP